MKIAHKKGPAIPGLSFSENAIFKRSGYAAQLAYPYVL